MITSECEIMNVNYFLTLFILIYVFSNVSPSYNFWMSASTVIKRLF